MNNEAKEFIKCVKDERGNFVGKINMQNWNTDMRCAAESLLIMYDQMIARLEQCEGKPVAYTNSGLTTPVVINKEAAVCTHEFIPKKCWVHKCLKCGELHIEYNEQTDL